MKTSRYTDSQIIGILKEGETMPVVEVIRRHGISRATFYHWRSRYGGMDISEVNRTKELEAELTRLKKMYAELALENAAIKDVLSRKL
jgi:putative transposase